MVLAAIVNVVQFPGIEQASPSHAAVQPRSSIALDDLAEQDGVERGFSTPRTRYLPYLQLGRVAEGADLTLAPGLGLSRPHLRAFGRVRNVTVDSDLVPLTREEVELLDADVRYEGEHHRAGPYVIAAADGDAEGFLGLPGPDAVYLVDARLVDALERDER